MKKKVFSFLKAIGYLLIAFAIQLIIGMIYGAIYMAMLIAKEGTEKFVNNTDELIRVYSEAMGQQMNTVLLISAIISLLIVGLIYKIGKKKVIKDFGLKNFNIANCGIAVIIGLSVWLINSGILSLVESAGLLRSNFENFAELTSSIVEGPVFMMILTAGIVVPFVEEFIFRGVIQKTLSKSMSIKAAIVIQGILFGIYHGNLIQGIYATFLGVVFGYVTYRCKSLWPAAVVHMVNNIIASTANYILPTSLNTTVAYICFAIVGIGGLVFSIVTINKKNPVIVENEEIISV